MNRRSVLVIIAFFCNVEVLYGMDDDKNINHEPQECPILVHYDQEAYRIQTELLGLQDKQKKLDDEFILRLEKYQQAQLEAEKRKTQKLERSLSMLLYSVAGIGIVVVWILLYEASKKPRPDKG